MQGLWRPDGIFIEPGEQHFENPNTKRRFNDLMESVGLKDKCAILKPVPVTDDDLLRVHTKEYVDRIRKQSSEMGGDAENGEHTTWNGSPFGPGSFEIAKLAAGGTSVCMEALLEGKLKYAYALVRPPGHHAERSHGYGFCLFSNIGVALEMAFAKHPELKRVAVLDYDVHHGNGTEHIFYDTEKVLTISMHQDGLFPPPPSGDAAHRGEGKGEGFNVNIPLPPGSGHGICGSRKKGKRKTMCELGKLTISFAFRYARIR